jgi:hypothetical protein
VQFVVPALAGQLPSGQLLLYERFKARLKIPCRAGPRTGMQSGSQVRSTGLHEIPTIYLSISCGHAEMPFPKVT